MVKTCGNQDFIKTRYMTTKSGLIIITGQSCQKMLQFFMHFENKI